MRNLDSKNNSENKELLVENIEKPIQGIPVGVTGTGENGDYVKY